MLQQLPTGTKISITRSINTALEQYMAEIEWNEDKFSMVEFMNGWSTYITTQASWYQNLEPSVKESPEFHEELANKINETIEKVLEEEPTPAQIERIEQLQLSTGTDMDYSCKAEAKYVIQSLERKLS
ncbi:hypothetical protein [Jeotgalibacillus salarius]|uniref:Group-specific protein n=1 Tax=Jeotgalibacillus salarius TaxID=546023 RepID=A0A4Y8LPZ9_9BACL|nr:hypothetical protein [Jeotgalibacillus salarius]TFE04091.1 hypothetical protein E2626_01845 [Jeotgalibacillus salarius]